MKDFLREILIAVFVALVLSVMLGRIPPVRYFVVIVAILWVCLKNEQWLARRRERRKV